MSKAFFDELHIIDLMAALSQGRQSEYHTPLDIDKIRAAALISQNRRWDIEWTHRTNLPGNGFFLSPLNGAGCCSVYDKKKPIPTRQIILCYRLCVWLCDD